MTEFSGSGWSPACDRIVPQYGDPVWCEAADGSVGHWATMPIEPVLGGVAAEAGQDSEPADPGQAVA